MTPSPREAGKPIVTRKEGEPDASARQHMIARHKLVEGMIRNNEQQLRNESARGGAEIERECALRDLAASTDQQSAQRQLEAVTERLESLEEDRFRLIAEREWLNSSLLEFEETLENPGLNAQGRA